MRWVLLFVLGCSSSTRSTPTAQPCAVDCVDASVKSLDGVGNVVSQLARSFLPSGKPEGKYVFHAYLYYAGTDLKSQRARLAAAAAVLRMFADTRTGGERADRAALHVPITTTAAARAVIKSRRPEDLVAQYDFDRAGMLRARVEKATDAALPRVALIGHPLPLDGVQAVDTSQLYWIDLDGLSDEEIDEKLTQFRMTLTSPNDQLDRDFTPWVQERTRNFFDRTSKLHGP